MKRLLSILGGLVTGGLILVIIAAAVLGFSARQSRDRIPTILGHKILTVISGSMEPAIHTGDVIIVEPTGDTVDYQVGDVLTFRSKENPNLLITHRVVGIFTINDQRLYMTKGDANDTEDLSPVAPSQVLGRYRWRVPYFAYLSNFIRQPLGIVLFVIVPGLVLIGLEFRKIWRALAEAEAPRAPAGAGTAASGEEARGDN